LESTKVSKRLLMFHVHFLDLAGRQTTDLFFGQPPVHVRHAFKAAVRSILQVNSWSGFYAACGQACPSPSQLTDMLKQATKNSLRKGYHSKFTDFSRIHASGVSHILRKGETYQIGHTVKNMRLELGSDSHMILCGACLIYEDLTCADVVCYNHRRSYHGAVTHSGDQQVAGKSCHVMNVDLESLPSSVNRLFFTLCSCGCENLSGFRNPSIEMTDQDGQPMCTYSIERAGQAPTVVMAAVWRDSASIWQVTAIGLHSRVRCCGNYAQVKRDIAGIKF